MQGNLGNPVYRYTLTYSTPIGIFIRQRGALPTTRSSGSKTRTKSSVGAADQLVL